MAHTKSLAEVKDEIVPVLQQQALGAAETNFSKALSDQAAKDGMEKTAAAHGLQVQTTDFLPKDGVVAGVSDSTGLMAQAFQTAKGAAPVSVSTGDGNAVFKVVDIAPPHAPTFEAWKSHVLDDYRTDKVPQLLRAELDKLDARAKELKDLGKAAAELNIPVTTSDLVGKDAQVPGVGAMSGPASVAFDLAPGAISGPISTGDGGVVLSVVDKQQPTAQEIAQNFSQTREQMLDTQREEVFRLYLGTLMEKYQKAGAIQIKQTAPSPIGLGQ